MSDSTWEYFVGLIGTTQRADKRRKRQSKTRAARRARIMAAHRNM